tara:strand:+ start:1510 stop:1761 length:252 start_codon:yes stop_codon:yes gene_type:complete
MVNEIAKIVTEKDKESISDIFLRQKNKTETEAKRFTDTDKNDLRVLFNLWAKYMPKHKQNWGCGGCRQLVNNFWYKVNQVYNN